jgi:hypothetical protein
MILSAGAGKEGKKELGGERGEKEISPLSSESTSSVELESEISA